MYAPELVKMGSKFTLLLQALKTNSYTGRNSETKL